MTSSKALTEPLTTKHKTMNDIILVVLPDGSVHRATLIEPGLGAPVYQLGKKAGAKERKPRTKTPTLVVGTVAVRPPAVGPQVANNNT